MSITNKAISTTFFNIIIRTYHGQTEIVIQYGCLRSSVMCVNTSCSNDSFASPTHTTKQSLDKAFCDVVPIVHNASRSACSVSRGLWGWWTRLLSSSYKCAIVDWSGDNVDQRRKRCDSGSESIDKHEPRDIVDCHVERRDQRRVWRYQRGNQNPYIEEEKTTEKVLKDKQRSTKHRYQTKDQATRTPLKPEVNSGAPHG